MNKRTNAQKNANWARAYGSAERVEWVGQRACVFCGRVPDPEHPNQNMHVRGGGVSRKADAKWIVPADKRCHDLQHHGKLGVSRDEMDLLAEWTESLWQQHLRQQDHQTHLNGITP